MTAQDSAGELAWQAVEHNFAKVAAWLVVQLGWPAERPPDELIVALAEFIWANREHRDFYWDDRDGGYDEFLAYMLE